MKTNSRSPMEVISKYKNQVPIPVVDIAIEMGLMVYKSNSWPDHISGLIRKEKDRYAIYTNAKHPRTRRRFTIAHELGHYVLHRDAIGEGITDDALYRSRLSGPLERQANRFAANLLMPWDLVVEATNQGIDTVEKLAAKFEVSRSAMSVRLEVPFETRPDHEVGE